MLNAIWSFMVLCAIVFGAFAGKLDEVTKASVDGAETAAKLAIGLIGVMAFWLGMMRVLEQAGILHTLARALKPIMKRIFPDVPAEHPAMSMMILNTSANMLGLSNAATPFGLKAMKELETLNPHPGTATNAMALFLAINTAGITLVPTTIIALRASSGSTAPGSIFFPTLLSSLIGTCAAVISALMLQKLRVFKAPATTRTISGTSEKSSIENEKKLRKSKWMTALSISIFAVLAGAFFYAFRLKVLTLGYGVALKSVVTDWPLVLCMALIVAIGLFKQVKVYDAVVEAGKESIEIAFKIIPYLVAMLVAVSMLRASGALTTFVTWLSPVTSFFKIPPEVLPMAFLRSLTGGGSLGYVGEMLKSQGPDSMISNMVSTIYGSSETTFYVLAVYFGSIQIKNARHSLAACLIADAVAVLASVWICLLFF